MIENFTFLGKEISAYMIAAFVGIIVACIYAFIQSKRFRLDYVDTIVLLLWAALGLFLGAHILYGITNIGQITEFLKHYNEKVKSFADFMYWLQYFFGGAVYYGGLIGGLIVAKIVCKAKKMPYGTYTDIASGTIPLFHVFGRIGCFLTGCCYGVESTVGVMYTHSYIASANGVTRFPIQLVEAFCNLLLFIFFSQMLRKGKFKNRLIYLYFIMYGIIRFVLEFWRGDDYRGFLFGLSTSQFISIVLIIYSVIMLIIKKNREETPMQQS